MAGHLDLGARSELSVPPEAVAALRRAGFVAVASGRSPTLGELAASAGVSLEDTVATVVALIERGTATVDAVGRLDGIAGLTRHPGRHAIEIDGRRLHTWCGFDAVGIPAAFGWTADALTDCGHCGASLRLPLRRGVPLASQPWGWLPPADCDHVLRDFCQAADLFCNRQHVEAWRTSRNDPAGRPASLAELAGAGRRSWADCAGATLPGTGGGP